MLPPIEDSVLHSNPMFAALHVNLTQHFLNADGSTKSYATRGDRDALSETYKQTRIRSAKSDILISALHNVDLTTSSVTNPETKSTPPLPPELIELVLLLSSILSSKEATSQATKSVLQSTPVLASFPTHLLKLAALLSAHLHTTSLALCRVAFPFTNPSYLHRQIPSLALHATTLRSTIASQEVSLSQQRIKVVALTTQLLATYHTLQALTISHLEQVKHGVISRHSKAKTEFLALRAREVAEKAKEMCERGERMVYSEAVVDALENYIVELKGATERLGERGREARRVLWGYGVGRKGDNGEKERKMRQIGRVYGELLGEIEEVKKDLGKLRGNTS